MTVKSFKRLLYVELQVVISVLLTVGLGSAISNVVKRHDNDFQTCLDNFDIHLDKIIRTQDSRKMGAKYLNEVDVASRNECLRMCCETEKCDVFVFEEKNPGSCYLFQCGSPDDFKCKFTRHSNYTSAVLAVNRHLTELESQIKFTQQEHELSKLREPPKMNMSKAISLSTQTPLVKNSGEYNLQLNSVLQATPQKKKACSRFQFECHKSGECIGIYNACDGIPQCSDGSDEALELGCPVHVSASPNTIVSTATGMPVALKNEPIGSASGSVNNKITQNVPNVPMQGHWNQLEEDEHPLNNGYNRPDLNPEIPLQMPRVNYGREGEGISNYPGQVQQWQGSQYQTRQNLPGVSQIFTHKGNGLLPQAEHYPLPQRPYSDIQGNIGPYNEQIPNEYTKYYYENVPYRMFPQSNQPNNWQTGNKIHNKPDDNRRVGNDYYYEDSYKNRVGIPSGPIPIESIPHQPEHQKELLTLAKPELNRGSPKIQVKVSTESPLLTTKTTATLRIKEDDKNEDKPNSHRKVDHLTVEARMQVNNFVEPERDLHAYSASGAILSLTLGLIITSIMVLVVGCRMRVVRRRMRRGGKSPYAHDADFLVNGMYL